MPCHSWNFFTEPYDVTGCSSFKDVSQRWGKLRELRGLCGALRFAYGLVFPVLSADLLCDDFANGVRLSNCRIFVSAAHVLVDRHYAIDGFTANLLAGSCKPVCSICLQL